jgi:hypothetical protein
MKKFLLATTISIVIAIAAFLAGRWFERTAQGYHYQVLEEKEIPGAAFPVRWKVVDERVGFVPVNMGTTLIEADGRIIYKAQRVFQEAYPHAKNVTANQGTIEWDDGEYSFSLKMQKLPAPTTSSQPANAVN